MPGAPIWRFLVVVLIAVGVSVVVSEVTRETLAAVWLPLLIGALTAPLGVAWAARPIRESVDELTAAVPDSPPRELSAAAAAAVDHIERQEQTIAALTATNHDLSQNTRLLETVLATMIEGVIVVDAQECVLYANPAARALLEIGDRATVQRPILEAARSPDIERTVRESLESGEMRQSEFELHRSQKTISVTASPFPSGTQRGVVLVLHDVTNLRRLERTRREFVSNVSHELKTPLTAIQAYSDTLLEGAVDDPDNNRLFLGRIAEQAVRLQTLIHDLLDLARLESQPARAATEPIDLATCVATHLNDHRRMADAKGVALEFSADDDVVVNAAAKGVQQIVDNLVNNAINYTPAEGSISVAVYADEDCGVIEVQDTGIGISREDQARIFERFYRADRARARSAGGTGLGLAIVKHTAQSFGGTVDVTSQLGEGSTFRVRLPLG